MIIIAFRGTGSAQPSPATVGGAKHTVPGGERGVFVNLADMVTRGYR